MFGVRRSAFGVRCPIDRHAFHAGSPLILCEYRLQTLSGTKPEGTNLGPISCRPLAPRSLGPVRMVPGSQAGVSSVFLGSSSPTTIEWVQNARAVIDWCNRGRLFPDSHLSWIDSKKASEIALAVVKEA